MKNSINLRNNKLSPFQCLFSGHTLNYEKGSDWAKNGITSLEKIRLNGVKHRVLIRGTHTDNPILLFIHPAGIPSMVFAHLEYAQTGGEIEKYFTVVHYDQRGFGKTYAAGKRGKKYITFDQYVSNAEALTIHLLDRFDKKKIFVLGESFGSIIGARLAKKRPEHIHAFISVGQVSNVPAYMNYLYDYAEERAENKNDEKILEKLAKPGRPVPGMKPNALFKSLQNVGDAANRYLAEESGIDTSAGIFFKSLREAPEYSMTDFQNTLTGFMFTQNKIIAEMMAVDMNTLVPELAVPVFFFMGEHDFWRELSHAYFTRLTAPKKEWFILKNAGHMARGDQPEEFLKLLIQKIHPIASA